MSTSEMTRDELLEFCRQQRSAARKEQKKQTRSVSPMNAARLQGEAKGRGDAWHQIIALLEPPKAEATHA